MEIKTYKPQELKMLGKKKAQEAIDFMSGLKLTENFHGQYFKPVWWQEKVIRDIYGTLKPTGYRQYTQVYLEIPKKQGKSGLVSGIGLKGLCADGEYNAEVYTCAADKGQASIIFDTSVEMLDQLFEDEPELKADFNLVLSKKRIVYYPTSSFYQVLSSEAYSKHGYKPYYVLFDEIHAQPNRDLYDIMTFGSGDARKQPLFWNITTAGDDPDRQSIGWELHQTATDILLGRRQSKILYPVVFGFDPEELRLWKGWEYEQLAEGEYGERGEEWKDRRIWVAVNPSLGHTVDPEKLDEAFSEVIGKPAMEKLFQWLRLNIWVRYKLTKWFPQSQWDASAGLVIPEKLEGRECYGGLDLSSKIDISALKLLFPPNAEDKKWRSLSFFWIPLENLKERVKSDGVLYDQWMNNGFIKATKGTAIDYKSIEQFIVKLKDKYNIKGIGFDPWNAYETAQNLQEEGLTMIEVRQGYKSMSEPMKKIEALIRSKRYYHGGNPVDRWMFGNVDVKTDENENIRPIKDKKGKNRIDGIVALINAMAVCVFEEREEDINPYQERGILGL
jgi:phage terminase large subunit-like protein